MKAISSYKYIEALGLDLSGQQAFIEEFYALVQERNLQRKLRLAPITPLTIKGSRPYKHLQQIESSRTSTLLLQLRVDRPPETGAGAVEECLKELEDLLLEIYFQFLSISEDIYQNH